MPLPHASRTLRRWLRHASIVAIGIGLTGCPLPNVRDIPPFEARSFTSASVSPANPEPQSFSSAPIVRFGVLAFDSASATHSRYRPILDYLEEKTGRRFELQILDWESQFDAVRHGQVDFATTNPISSVQLQRLYETEFLVTTNRSQSGTQFAGSIVVRRNSDIQKVADLKGKRAACVDFQTAAGGCIFQIYHLKRQGFDPFEQFASFSENDSQDNVVLALLNGTIDVGFIRTGQLEMMHERGIVSSLDTLRVFQPAQSGFPLAHTTPLYPEWPISKLAHTDPELAAAVRQALLELTPDHPASSAAQFDGFVPALDYSELAQPIDALNLRTSERRQQATRPRAPQ